MANESFIHINEADYVVMIMPALIIATIGLYFGSKDRKSIRGMESYIIGDRTIHFIPVGISLSVTFFTSIGLLGYPAEVYLYGTMSWWALLSLFIVVVVTGEIYIPLLYRLKITSIYEYLEIRFNRSIRTLAAVSFLVEMLFYEGLIVYSPALALTSVTDITLLGAIFLVVGVSTFCTAVGGIKTIIMASLFEALVVVVGTLVITFGGFAKLGGSAKVWKINRDNGRIDFNHFELDPRIRHTFWSIVIGGAFSWLGVYAVNQTTAQRYFSCKSAKEAKRALLLNFLGLIILLSCSMINGAILYAYFHGCDPILAQKISKIDQLIPLMVVMLFQDCPGIGGLLMAWIFCGSASGTAFGINAMASVMIEDIIRPRFQHVDANKVVLLTQVLVVLIGALCICNAFFVSHLGALLTANLNFSNILRGPMIAVFTLGMIFPFTNAKGVFLGHLFGIAIGTWVLVGRYNYPPGQEFERKLPVTIELCPLTSSYGNTSNEFVTARLPNIASDDVLNREKDFTSVILYHYSYAYLPCLGFSASLVMGLIASLFSDGWKRRRLVDPSLIYFFFDHPFFEWLPAKFRKEMRFGLENPNLEEAINSEFKFESDDGTKASRNASRVDKQLRKYVQQLLNKKKKRIEHSSTPHLEKQAMPITKHSIAESAIETSTSLIETQESNARLKHSKLNNILCEKKKAKYVKKAKSRRNEAMIVDEDTSETRLEFDED